MAGILASWYVWWDELFLPLSALLSTVNQGSAIFQHAIEPITVGPKANSVRFN